MKKVLLAIILFSTPAYAGDFYEKIDDESVRFTRDISDVINIKGLHEQRAETVKAIDLLNQELNKIDTMIVEAGKVGVVKLEPIVIENVEEIK